jgi:hypothetical protein
MKLTVHTKHVTCQSLPSAFRPPEAVESKTVMVLPHAKHFLPRLVSKQC